MTPNIQTYKINIGPAPNRYFSILWNCMNTLSVERDNAKCHNACTESPKQRHC